MSRSPNASLQQVSTQIGTLLMLIAALLAAALPARAQLRPSLTFGHETWPSVSISNLEVVGSGAQSLDDLEVWTDTRFVRASYPLVVHGGRTFLDVQAGFQRIQFRYEGWREAIPAPTDAYIIDLTLLAQRQLSARWVLVAQANPALKSGLEAELVRDDFAIEGAVLASRRTGQRSVLGIGVAYSTNFGAPLPIPLLQLGREGTLWEGGPAWRGNALLPSTIDLWVVPARRLEAGVQVRTLGDRHHLTENAPTLSHPYSDYFDFVAGPSANLYVTPWLTIGVESGVSLYRQVQITDGRDEVISFEPDRSGFIRWQVTIGGPSPLVGP